MSEDLSNTAGPPDGPQPDLAQPDPRARRPRSRRQTILAAVVALVVVLVGGGAFAAYQLLAASGPTPAQALPDTTLAVAWIDLDPSASQKVAAYETMNKFPALRQQLHLGSTGDLRKLIFDKAIEHGSCSSLNYDTQIAPWIGDRAAFGAVDTGSKTPAPVVAVAENDQAKATSAMQRLVACSHAHDVAYGFENGYLVASDTQAHVDAIVARTKTHPLADDPGFTTWMNAAGSSGIASFYVAKRAATFLAHGLLNPMGSSIPATSTMIGGAVGSLHSQLAKFQGLGATLRFDGGGLELEVATAGTGIQAATTPVGQEVTGLPADTAAVVGFAVPPNYAASLVHSLRGVLGQSQIASLETQLGIRLPQDLQTLLGKTITVSLGGQAPASLAGVHRPQDVPIATTITGNAAKIQGVIHKLEMNTGRSLSGLGIVQRSGNGRVVLATQPGYAATLVKGGGSLGSDPEFSAAVPNASQAGGVFFLRFDSAWRQTILRSAFSGERAAEAANTAPLAAFGISWSSSNGIDHVLLRLTTH